MYIVLLESQILSFSSIFYLYIRALFSSIFLCLSLYGRAQDMCVSIAKDESRGSLPTWAGPTLKIWSLTNENRKRKADDDGSLEDPPFEKRKKGGD